MVEIFFLKGKKSSSPGPAREKVITKIPQRRAADPREIRGVTLLLASDASSFMTGWVIVVNGGHILG